MGVKVGVDLNDVGKHNGCFLSTIYTNYNYASIQFYANKYTNPQFLKIDLEILGQSTIPYIMKICF